MQLKDLLKELSQHNETGKMYQVQLNSSNLDSKSNRHMDVEFGDMYFTGCMTLGNEKILCFDNTNAKPIGKLEDGTNLYPEEINSQMFIHLDKIEKIEEVKDIDDWFALSTKKVINIYMRPEDKNMTGCRNVVTIGFAD